MHLGEISIDCTQERLVNRLHLGEISVQIALSESTQESVQIALRRDQCIDCTQERLVYRLHLGEISEQIALRRDEQ